MFFQKGKQVGKRVPVRLVEQQLHRQNRSPNAGKQQTAVLVAERWLLAVFQEDLLVDRARLLELLLISLELMSQCISNHEHVHSLHHRLQIHRFLLLRSLLSILNRLRVHMCAFPFSTLPIIPSPFPFAYSFHRSHEIGRPTNNSKQKETLFGLSFLVVRGECRTLSISSVLTRRWRVRRKRRRGRRNPRRIPTRSSLAT